MMNVNIHNHHLEVKQIEITGLAASSLFLIGDADHIQLASSFDTPPESYVFQSIFPLGPVTGGQ